jgi:putative ATPase
MLKVGEDPVFIARRLVILASEDVGNADPKALEIAVSGLHAVELVGMPEAGITLAQVVTYLASAPKSNRSYLAYKKALALVEETDSLEIPLHLRSAQTKLTRDLGYGKNYLYSHDYERGFSGQKHMPESLQNQKLYEPSDHGFEKKIKEYLSWLRGLSS